MDTDTRLIIAETKQITLLRAIMELRIALETIHRSTLAKQSQRAEPWHQSMIDICERALKRFKDIMEELK